jgi:hypothetical protein
MRRSISVILWILVGACASGIGIGVFFVQANRDRARLIEEAERARREAEDAQAMTDRLAEEANAKVTAANAEVSKARELLKKYEEERALLANAKALTPPNGRLLRSWSEAFSIPLGVSVKLPPGTRALRWDDVLAAGTWTTSSTDQWLNVFFYRPNDETILRRSVPEAESVAYLVDGQLLVGVRGALADGSGTLYVLRTLAGATSTHLLWASTNDAVNETRLLETLATLQFKS